MFVDKPFISHTGKELSFKIECDHLTDEDIDTIAKLVGKTIYFTSVYGIPTGGMRFAKALEPYISKPMDRHFRLVVDDVLTTGKSMDEVYQPGDIGIVLYARGKYPFWVFPVFTLHHIFWNS